MRKVLIIVTRNDERFIAEIPTLLEEGDYAVQSADLTGKEADYDLLLDQVFGADSVQVW